MAIIFSLLMSIGLINGNNINTQDKHERGYDVKYNTSDARGGVDWEDMH